MQNLRQMKILIVDDDPTSRNFLKGILENNGYGKIRLSDSGEEAFDLIERKHPDIILLDIFMPGIDGYEVCRRVRTNESTSLIPILMVTGGAVESDESIAKSFQAGATDFLTKPIRAIELLSRVKASLMIKQNQDRLSDELKRRLKVEKEKEQLIIDLQQTLAQVKHLSGLLPICSYCKQIRDDKGYWSQVDSYIQKYSEAEISHSICPDCAKEFYPDIDIYGDEKTQQ